MGSKFIKCFDDVFKVFPLLCFHWICAEDFVNRDDSMTALEAVSCSATNMTARIVMNDGGPFFLDAWKDVPHDVNGNLMSPGTRAPKNSLVKQEDRAALEEEMMDSGERRLNQLGYKQELRREMVKVAHFTCIHSSAV